MAYMQPLSALKLPTELNAKDSHSLALLLIQYGQVPGTTAPTAKQQSHVINSINIFWDDGGGWFRL
ncbi:MAG: hypothetical protein GY832_06170 [Chloroflexi bacterium]|nr:hypothetical protein [Chloroflexota bacterium]